MRRGEKQQSDAKKQKDLIKLNCLVDKLAQSQGQVHDAESGMAALSEAVSIFTAEADASLLLQATAALASMTATTVGNRRVIMTTGFLSGDVANL